MDHFTGLQFECGNDANVNSAKIQSSDTVLMRISLVLVTIIRDDPTLAERDRWLG